MPHLHITRELLWAVLRKEAAREILEQAIVEAVADACPFCREELAAWDRERRVSPTEREGLLRLPLPGEPGVRAASPAARLAGRDLRKLLTFPLAERLRKIDRSVERYRSPQLARLLLDQARQEMPVDMGAARELAQTADAVLRHAADSPGMADLWARTAAYLGHAARACDDLPEAEKRFALARSLVAAGSVTDPAVRAEIDACEAQLHLERRLFHRAETLLVRSICQSLVTGTPSDAAASFITLGLSYFHEGNLRKALEATRFAAQSLNPRLHLRLYATARLHLAWFSWEAGDRRTAPEILEADRGFFAKLADASTTHRINWLCSRIAADRGTSGEGSSA